MPIANQPQPVWQEAAIASVVNLVQAADGDFGVIDKLSEVMSNPDSLQSMFNYLTDLPEGKRALQERPRVGAVDLQTLSQLPIDSFGYAYSQHMLANHLKPIQAGPVETDLQYIGAHITETHDIWHVITGCNTSIFGELQLEAFYVAQLHATRFWLALLTKNLFKAVVYDIEISGQYMEAICQGWQIGKQAKPLFGTPWQQLWQQPLSAIRAELEIERAED
jgi:ubiquinone biosynthesis protein COQ4